VFNELTLLLHILLLVLIYAFLMLTIRVISRDLVSTKDATKEKSPRLVVLRGNGPVGHVYPIKDQLLIGRASDCEIILDDTFASSHHARVYSTGASFWLEDLKSTNGTTVADKKISSPVRLKKGSKFKIGQSEFRFLE